MDRKVSMREVIVLGYRDSGYAYFFKGLAPTLVRGFITNAVALPAFEYLNKRYNSKYDWKNQRGHKNPPVNKL